MHNLEILTTKELEKFFIHKYQNKANKHVDDFLIISKYSKRSPRDKQSARRSKR